MKARPPAESEWGVKKATTRTTPDSPERETKTTPSQADRAAKDTNTKSSNSRPKGGTGHRRGTPGEWAA